MWLRASLADNAISANPGYVKQLREMDLFPCSSFYNIELDVPRLQFGKEYVLGSSDEKNLRKMGRELLFNYTKRNAIYSYIQSQGPTASKLTLMCYKAFPYLDESQRNEKNFWLYTQMYDHILPIGFHC